MVVVAVVALLLPAAVFFAPFVSGASFVTGWGVEGEFIPALGSLAVIAVVLVIVGWVWRRRNERSPPCDSRG
jgi:membrane protein implicated in regulation of membrane protease activity